jgi:hypothetical protein
VSARVLWSLHPATQAPNFYEKFFSMCRRRIPEGDREYRAWRREIAEAMERGEELRYLGYYVIRDQPDEPDATVT